MAEHLAPRSIGFRRASWGRYESDLAAIAPAVDKLFADIKKSRSSDGAAVEAAAPVATSVMTDYDHRMAG
jgi:hypothetical protein